MNRLFVVAAALAAAGVASRAHASDQRAAPAINPVIEWNKTLLSIVRTPGAQSPTIHPTRSFALMHAAIYDAVDAIDRTHTPYAVRFSNASPRASQNAAAAAAAHDVLVSLYPAFGVALDAELQHSLLIRDGGDQRAGIEIGQMVAARLLALRSHDGSGAAPIPYVFGSAPGAYQSTPPNFAAQPQFTHWAFVAPFALGRADQFRPGPPPALTSERYADALDEVQSVGVADSTSATPDEALTGRFWNGAIQNYWNEIAQTIAISQRLSTAQTARLFALLNLSLADGVIAFYDAKYTYNLWRPVTAIRAADTDGNPETVADPNWLPEVGKTGADPSYPGAHAVLSAAAASVLVAVLKRDHIHFDVTSEVLPGTVRSFTTVSAAATEASLSRVFAGQHFRFDQRAGQRLGRDVADFVVDHFLTPTSDRGDER